MYELMKNIITALILLASAVPLNAQSSWNVNPQSYQYSMTIVAFLNVNDKELIATADKVAAFVGDEVRGVGSPVFVTSADRYLVFLTIFANKENELVKFRIFDSTTGNVADVERTLNFRIDAQHGNAFQA